MAVRDPKRETERPISHGATRYPNNSLREQVRSFDDVPSLNEVVLNHFKNKNPDSN